MLKREAQENENAEFEQQAQQFFNSIESNMSTLVTQQPMEVETAVANTPTEAVAEIAAEEPNQYRVVLGTSSGDSQPVTLSLQVRKVTTINLLCHQLIFLAFSKKKYFPGTKFGLLVFLDGRQHGNARNSAGGENNLHAEREEGHHHPNAHSQQKGVKPRRAPQEVQTD